MTDNPLAIDLFCGLFGWSEGLVAEGWQVVGVDIEDMHGALGMARPSKFQLVIQDVRTLHGSQFRSAHLIVASPPCQRFSYMAMPWSLAKAQARAIRADASGQMLADLTELFDACFRIQREASEAADRHIPLVVENVKGAQPWVGRARWNWGSFYLWGDVPALMPLINHRQQEGFKVPSVAGLSWSGYGKPGYKARAFNGTAERQLREAGIKQGGSGAAWWRDALNERRKEGTAIKNGKDWFGSGADCSLQRRYGSNSSGRNAASAMIAKIPLPLARHIAAVYRP